MKHIIVYSFLVATVFSATIAMEQQEQSAPNYQTIKMQAKTTLLQYLQAANIDDKEMRIEVAFKLDKLFSDTQLSQPWEKVNKDEPVPGEEYTFAYLETQVAQRYHLARLDKLYRLLKKPANH